MSATTRQFAPGDESEADQRNSKLALSKELIWHNDAACTGRAQLNLTFAVTSIFGNIGQ